MTNYKNSNLFYEKLYKDVYNMRYLDNFIWSTYYYVIDSKYREKEQLSKFLSKQLISPNKDMIELAVSLIGKDDDETIINILKYVLKTFRYKDDKSNWGSVEYWATAYEALEKKVDDCDGFNTVIYVLARLAGIHQYKLQARIGYALVKNSDEKEGHFYLTYFSTKTKKMYAIDGTFYPDKVSIANRTQFKDLSYYEKPWYIFNEDVTIKPL